MAAFVWTGDLLWLRQGRLAGLDRVSRFLVDGDGFQTGCRQFERVTVSSVGRIELDTNIVERGIRPIVLNRKNALFAGHDEGAKNWACVASLIETCKLNNVDPQSYIADVLDKLVNLWPASHIDDLMPWAWAKACASDRLAA